MNQVVIENPIINLPFDQPDHRFRLIGFFDEGITDEIVDGRQASSHFAEVAKKYGDAQIEKAHPVRTLRG